MAALPTGNGCRWSRTRDFALGEMKYAGKTCRRRQVVLQQHLIPTRTPGQDHANPYSLGGRSDPRNDHHCRICRSPRRTEEPQGSCCELDEIRPRRICAIYRLDRNAHGRALSAGVLPRRGQRPRVFIVDMLAPDASMKLQSCCRAQPSPKPLVVLVGGQLSP